MLGLDIVEGIKQNRDPFYIARAEDNGRNIYLSRHKLLGKVAHPWWRGGAHFRTELVLNQESRRGRQVRGYGSG